MATDSSFIHPEAPTKMRKGFARRCERFCCSCLVAFPLSFVYGLTSWAAWVQASIGFQQTEGAWSGYTTAVIGIILYVLLNWSYTTAVFTDPGSPLNTQDPYQALPSSESAGASSLTVKSTGEARFCKKCHTTKPDRAHHCSSCRRCVLKMDHHCPWLSTCVGLHNYKPFLLFLSYVSIFCWLCFLVSGTWFFHALFTDSFQHQLLPINNILLAVLSGIIGLVLTGFTGWHIYLAVTGQTTIESLEKTRYLAPVRQSMQRQLHHQRNYIDENATTGDELHRLGDQLREIHANALPGVLRPEEGESRSRTPTSPSPTPAQGALHRNLQLEQNRERARYNQYLDEKDAERLPNAFDLGWRRNLYHVFGPTPALWGLPIINTTGDGWTWEPSAKWLAARDELAREREANARENAAFESEGSWSRGNVVNFRGDLPRSTAPPPMAREENGLAMAGLAENEDHDSSSDEESGAATKLMKQAKFDASTANWNDIPAGFLHQNRRNATGAKSPRRPRHAD